MFLSFIGQNGSNSDRKTSRFARFTVVRLKNMNPDASFTMLMLMGKKKTACDRLPQDQGSEGAW